LVCWRLRASLVDLAEGTLPAAGRAGVERHVAVCASCAATVAALRELPERLRGVELPGDAFWQRQRADILRAVRGLPVPASPPRAWPAWPMGLAVAASVLLAVLAQRLAGLPRGGSDAGAPRAVAALDAEAALALLDAGEAMWGSDDLAGDALGLDWSDDDLEGLDELVGATTG
jgi:hypothetical protein